MKAPTTTIQIRRPTQERLNALRAVGLTYDDVINFALDNVPEERIKTLYEEWQAHAMEKLLGDARVHRSKPSRKKA